MKKFFAILLLFTSFFCFADVEFDSVPASSVMLLDGSNPMQADLDMAGFNILNLGPGSETDPLSIHFNGDNSPTATIDWDNQDLIGVKELQLDRGTGLKYRLRQIYGLATAIQPETGDGAFVHAIPSDDSTTRNVGFSINRRVGVDVNGDANGNPIDVLNFFYIVGRSAYVIETRAFNGGSLFDLIIDHGGDGDFEWRWFVNGDASAENNNLINVGTLEIDPGTGSAYKFEQTFGDSLSLKPNIGGGFFDIASANDTGTEDSRLSVARRSGGVSGPVERLNLAFRNSDDWYEIGTDALFGGFDKDIVIDHLSDGTPEFRFNADGSASAENNALNNVASFELDPGSGTAFTTEQILGTKMRFKSSSGAGAYVFSSGVDDGSVDSFLEMARRTGASGGAREVVLLGYRNSDDSFYLGSDITDGGIGRNLHLGVNGVNKMRFATNGDIDFLGNTPQGVGTPTIASHVAPKSYVDSFVFGNEVQTAASLANSTTTSGTYQTKLSLITPSLPAGDYYIAWSADIGNTNANGDSSLRFLLDGVTTTNEASAANGWAAGGYMAAGGHTVETFGIGARTLALQFLAGSQTAQIRNARIGIWRIN